MQHAKKAVKGSQAAPAETPSEFGAELEVCFPSARTSNEAVLALCDGVALHGTASATAAADRFAAPLPVCLASAWPATSLLLWTALKPCRARPETQPGPGYAA